MKSIICIISILMIAQYGYAIEYPPIKDQIIKEFGEKYYSLRAQLPLEQGYFRSDEASINRKKYINIILRLLSDREITKAGDMGMLESVSKNSPEFIYDECIFLFDSLFELINIAPYQNIYEAMGDKFRLLSQENKEFMDSIIKKRNKFYSILYQKKEGIPKDCADISAKSVFAINKFSRKLNNNALNGLKKVIDNGCTSVGVLFSYSNALVEEGKFANNQNESRDKIINLYHMYFDGLSENDINSTEAFYFLRRISYFEFKKNNNDGVHEVNKRIVTYISSSKIKLKKQPKWVREGYLKLLSRSIRSKNENHKREIIGGLRRVYQNKGDIFMLSNENGSSNLNDDEKQLLKLIQKENRK